MKDKDKLWIILYYGFKECTSVIRIRQSLDDAQHYFSSRFDDSVNIVVLPVFDTQNHRIEYINTEKLTDEELKTFYSKVEECKKIIIGKNEQDV